MLTPADTIEEDQEVIHLIDNRPLRCTVGEIDTSELGWLTLKTTTGSSNLVLDIRVRPETKVISL